MCVCVQFCVFECVCVCVWVWVCPHLTKASSMSWFFLSPTYSPIRALLSPGLSSRNPATSTGFKGEWSTPCSTRKATPDLGFLLNCSVAARISFK